MKWNPLKTRVSFVAQKIKQVGDVVVEVAHAVNDWDGAPKLRNYLAVGAIGISKLAELGDVDPETAPNIQYLDFGCNTYVARLCEEVAGTKLVSSGTSKMRVFELFGETILGYGAINSIDLYCVVDPDDPEDNSVERAYAAVGRAIWEKHGNFLEITSGRTDMDSGAPEILPWDVGNILYSPQTYKLIDRIKAFLDKGHTRSLMLDGPPGTGKSSMVKAIAHSLGWPTMYIGIHNLGPYTLEKGLKLLRPYVVIIDDIDRYSGIARLLPTIDRIRSQARVLLVTVNHRESLDSAITRAGRFDEVVKVNRVLSANDLIPNLPEEYDDELNTWPIAFVEELRQRLDTLSMDALEDELKELRPRVLENSEDAFDPSRFEEDELASPSEDAKLAEAAVRRKCR